VEVNLSDAAPECARDSRSLLACGGRIPIDAIGAYAGLQFGRSPERRE
jgi:hypothetical protein